MSHQGGTGQPEGVAVLQPEGGGGVPRQEGEQAGGRVAGGVGNPLQAVLHHGGVGGGDQDAGEGDGEVHLLPRVVGRLGEG